eukprot:m.141607 g.141607  ORF g.141607 m.141607 type:complete len:378 (+) comp22870_c0_seq1:48-1181(+)
MRRRRGPGGGGDGESGPGATEGGEAGAAGAGEARPEPTGHSFVGTYRRQPTVENGWHIGTITHAVKNAGVRPPLLDASGAAVPMPVVDAGGVTVAAAPEATLLWTNEEGVQWELIPTKDADVWRTGSENPYLDTAPTFLLIRDAEGAVFGFTFNSETYRLGDADTAAGAASLVEHPLEGTYRRFPVENDWHVGRVTLVAGATGGGSDGVVLQWTNNAGVGWTLQPADDPDILQNGPTCPYVETTPLALVKRSADGEILGFEFGDDFFRLADLHPLEGTYKRSPAENGFHVGRIAAVECPAVGADEPAVGAAASLHPLGLWWTNDEGVGWAVHPTDVADVYRPGAGNPYSDVCNEMTAHRSDGRITGFEFNGDIFRKS